MLGFLQLLELKVFFPGLACLEFQQVIKIGCREMKLSCNMVGRGELAAL
jgi:hypothetical protein